MEKMIIEGMDTDNVGINYVICKQKILEDANLLIPEFSSYKMKLIGRLNQKGEFTLEDEGNMNTSDIVEQKIKYSPFGMPQSPQTIIIEDGRVFSWANQKRLEAVILDIEHAGGFKNAYDSIEDDPGKYYNGVMREENGVIKIIQAKN